MTSGFTNLDALFLEALAGGTKLFPADQARLLKVAQHLQGMDEKLANATLDFESGLAEGARRSLLRSNVTSPRNKVFDVRDGQVVIKAMSEGKVKKIPLGVSGLPKPEPKVIIPPSKVPPARKGYRLTDL